MLACSPITALPITIVLVAVLCGITRLRYTIDDRFVRVVLGGFTLRQIALTDIESVDMKMALWNKHWCNSLFAWRHSVRIRRKTGIARNFIITPANRDEFIAKLREQLSGNHK